MATQIKIKSQDQQDLDELNALNDQTDLDELNALNSAPSVNPLDFISKNSNAILNTLDLERRYASPAAILAKARPDLLNESERGSGYGEGQSQFPSMAELLNRRAAKGGETFAERELNKYPREIGGLLADMATPSTLLSIGSTVAPKIGAKFPKWAQTAERIYQGATNPLGEIVGAGKSALATGGEALYQRPFRRIDATADVKNGVQRISDLAKEYGITGNYQQILTQLREKLGQEGANIGNTVDQLTGKLSGSDIMNLSENAASMKLGSTTDRNNILNFINKEIENMTPESVVADRAKYAAEKSRYNDQILAAEKELAGLEVGSPEYLQKVAQQEERFGRQGTLFERPKTETYQEKIPVNFESQQSKVIGGDFENFPQSTIGTATVRNPDVKVWEVDPRNPNLQRNASRLEDSITMKIADKDGSGPTLMKQGAPDYYLPIGQGNNYSPKPQVVDQVTSTTLDVPLSTTSARDIEQQIQFSGPQFAAPLLEPVAPADKIFSQRDLFDLKGTLGNKAFKGVPDATTGATTQVSKKQMMEIYGAFDKEAKKAVEQELGQAEAKKFINSIEKYAQLKKNKGGFKKLEKLAENEAAMPAWGIKNVDLSRPATFLDVWPNALTPSAGFQTKTGMGAMKAAEKIQPWMIQLNKIGAKPLTPMMINDYEQ